MPDDINFYGADQEFEPPDTQIAAGYDFVVEAVNAVMTARTKAGQIIGAADLNSFFSVPTNQSFSDPSVVFDPNNGRWFMSGASFDSNLNSRVYLAMSTSSDPTQRWLVTLIAANNSRIAFDQPKLGVTSDKVMMTWNTFGCPTTTSCQFQHTQIVLLDKSDLYAGIAPRAFFYTNPQPAVVPAETLWGTGEAYLAFYDPYSNAAIAGVLKFTGSPASGGVAFTESDWVVPPRTEPPDADEPGGGIIHDGDSRVVSLVYRNGRLLAAQTVGCLPSGDTAERACGVVVELHPALFFGGANAATDLVTIGGAGNYVYYPAVMTDQADNVYTVATESSNQNTIYPSVIVTAVNGNTNASTQTALANGSVPYDTETCGGGNAWGDYSGYAADPVAPNDVWLAGELAVPGASFCPSGGWGTAIGRFTYAAPTVLSASPTMGSTNGGRAVTIRGSDFYAPMGGAVYFGSTPAQSYQFLSPDLLTAITPAEPPGVVTIMVSTADGTASGPQFTFLTPFARVGSPQGSGIATTRARQPAPQGGGPGGRLVGNPLVYPVDGTRLESTLSAPTVSLSAALSSGQTATRSAAAPAGQQAVDVMVSVAMAIFGYP